MKRNYRVKIDDSVLFVGQKRRSFFQWLLRKPKNPIQNEIYKRRGSW